MSKELYEAERYLFGPSLGSKTATVYRGEEPGTYDVTVNASRPNGKIVGVYHGIQGSDDTLMDLRMSSRLKPETAARLALVPGVPTVIWTTNKIVDVVRGAANLARRALKPNR